MRTKSLLSSFLGSLVGICLGILSLGIFATLFSQDAVAAPQKKPFSMSSKACRSWRNFAIERSKLENQMQSDQIVVMRANGDVLFSWEDAPYRRSSPHQMWSVSKTITSVIAATAIHEGKLNLNDRLTEYFPVSQRRNPYGASFFQAITVENLLEMTSGFKWSEHSSDEVKEASVLPMMYSQGYKNFTRYILDLDLVSRPGALWNYSSVNADLLMAILKKVYGKNYDDMPWKNLFDPLGMKSAHFEQDSAGVYIGGAYAYLSAEDMAKLGLLMLNDGVVKGRRLLPEGWVARSKQPLPLSYAKIHKRADFSDYGVFSKGGWWLNLPVPGVGKPYPKSPESFLFADGYLGQWLVILPEKGLILARTGREKESAPLIDSFVSGAVACFAK